MLPPAKFERIVQPAGSLICGACVCAMAVGKSLDEVLQEWDWRRLTRTSGVVQFLAAHGIQAGVSIVPDGVEPFSFTFDPRGRPAIMSARSNTYENGEHFIFWDGEQVLDPSPGPIEGRQYSVFDAMFLTYIDDSQVEPWDEDLPADWRECIGTESELQRKYPNKFRTKSTWREVPQ